MKNTRILRRTRRAGLTLIELIVVLAILVALGGIAVAVAPDLIKRTHSAEHATNAQVVETAVRTNTLLSNGSIGTGCFTRLETATVCSNHETGITGSSACRISVIRVRSAARRASSKLAMYSGTSARISGFTQPDCAHTVLSRVKSGRMVPIGSGTFT